MKTEISDWIVRAALAGTSEVALVDGACEQLGNAGVALVRVTVGTYLLDPTVDARVVRWVRDQGAAEEALSLANDAQANENFVRSPFLIEGVLQAVAACALAMLILAFAYFALHGHLDATLSQLTGVRLSFLHPLTLLATLTAAGCVGALGSALSLRRYLQV